MAAPEAPLLPARRVGPDAFSREKFVVSLLSLRADGQGLRELTPEEGVDVLGAGLHHLLFPANGGVGTLVPWQSLQFFCDGIPAILAENQLAFDSYLPSFHLFRSSTS